jgi:UDP-N-acetylmuramyl pentapeptide phosphotransferase/UDP-N-acetylglucosamine-1-phosphate transferase
MAGALRLLGMAFVFVIGIGIALVVLDANEDSDVVAAWLDVCRFLTGPFDDIFDLERGKEHLQIAINWGIAALVYFALCVLLSRLAARAGSGTAGVRRRLSRRRA